MTHTDSESQSPDTNGLTDRFGAALGMLLLRIWLGIRALQSGIEKFAGMEASDQVVEVDGELNEYGLVDTDAEKVYSLGNMHGVPEAMYDRFLDEPLIPNFALGLYDKLLGPALIILGLTVLLGIALRCSLFAMGLVYTSLTFGLILLGQDAGVAWLGIHILLIAAALLHIRYNRFSIMKRF